MLLDFEKKLASFVKERHLLSAASNVVLAVSGGADSTALLYALRTLKDEKILTARFICAHVNHQLRGAEADSDEAFVVAEASGLKLDVTTRRVDVRGFAREHKLSIETAARQCRMKALMGIAKANDCDRIATGHQKNDNAETVLHRLVRGTGYRGLGGIWPERGFADGVTFIRPMLCVTREEVIDYLQTRNLKWRRDRTNTDCTYKRNFIRHRLAPVLQQDCGDSLVETLLELSRCARRFYSRVCDEADEIWPSLAERAVERATLDLEKLTSQPLPVLIELIRRSLDHLGCGQRGFTRRHYERIVQLAKQDVAHRTIEVPGGVVVQRDYGQLIFSRQRRVDCRAGCSPPVRLNIPGQTTFGPYLIEAAISKTVEDGADLLSCHFDRRTADSGPERANLSFDKKPLSTVGGCLDYARHDKRSYVEYFDLDKVELPLSIRLRRPGDRFIPLGMSGEKKIGKFLTAQHVSHEVRQKIILVEDREKILWVWPIRISEQAKVTTGTRQLLRLQIREPDG